MCALKQETLLYHSLIISYNFIRGKYFMELFNFDITKYTMTAASTVIEHFMAVLRH